MKTAVILIAFILAAIASYLLGIGRGAVVLLRSADGQLLVASEDIDGPSLLVQLDRPLDLTKKSYVILRVSKNASFYKFSQK